jgi:hypothetical protein
VPGRPADPGPTWFAEAVTAPETALLTVTAVHVGFQTTVTTLVYPALARVPASQWASAHRAHARAITPIVGLLYGALAICGSWVLLSGPQAWALAALAALTVTVLITALAAAPMHQRLGSGRDPQRIRTLVQADRLRAATAALAFIAAALAVR